MHTKASSASRVLIQPYQAEDEGAVIALWNACGLTRPWNDPKTDIARKLTTEPDLFLIARVDDDIAGSAMAGFDGHRGWVYYLAVSPELRKLGVGRALMERVEQLLIERGCPKINLQIREGNESVAQFYQALGYQTDPVVSMGNRLIKDD